MSDEQTTSTQTTMTSEAPPEPQVKRGPGRPRKDQRQRPQEAPPAHVPVDARAPFPEEVRIEVPRVIHVKQLVSAIVYVKDPTTGKDSRFTLQFTAAEKLEPAKPCEVVPGCPQLLRLKREATA